MQIDTVRMKRTRIDRGLQQKDLADAVRISTSHMSDIERGRKGVSLPLVFRLADALGLKPRDLMIDEDAA